MDKYEKMATKIAENPTTSTKMMCMEDRIGGIRQMLEDLERLARVDGCIAAAWAYEYITETNNAGDNRKYFEVRTHPLIKNHWITNEHDYLLKDGTVASKISNTEMGYWETKESAKSFLEKWQAVYE